MTLQEACRTLIVIVVALACGCTSPVAEQAVAVPPATVAPAKPTNSPTETQAANVARERWETLFIDKDRIGFGRTTYRDVVHEGTSAVEITSVSRMEMKRFGQAAQQELTSRSIETTDGRVLHIESVLDSNGSTIQTKGRVDGGRLKLDVTTAGKTVTSEIPWTNSCRGFFAVDDSLRAKPMVPGEARTVRMLMLGFNQVATVELAAGKRESTSLPDGEQQLLRINAHMTLGEQPFDQTLWCDEQGEVVKSHFPVMNQFAYRSTPDTALQPIDSDYDIGERTLIRLDRPLQRPHTAVQTKYLLMATDTLPDSPLAHGGTQTLTFLGDGRWELVVRRANPEADAGAQTSDKPGAEYLATNSLIQSDDPRIVTMANEVAVGVDDPWRVVVALEQQVRRFMRPTQFVQAMGSASDVIESRTGDCTEHAVLLAALCRARNIPARVAVGLVYVAGTQAFAFHMWDEVFIGSQWIPIDATLGLGGIGSAHLKVTDSSLAGQDSFSQFLPVLNIMGRLKVEVIEESP